MGWVTEYFPRAWRTPINERFNDVHGLIDVAHDNTFEYNPSAILEIFVLITQHAEIKGMTARTMRALWHARTRIDAKFRTDPVNRTNFLAILQAPTGLVLPA